MNEQLLDSLLAEAIPSAGATNAPFDWEVIIAWMTIKLGSDLPTLLDGQIGRSIHPDTGRARRVLRYSWHRELLDDLSSLDDLIHELAIEFMQRSSGRKLEPGSGPGHIVRLFKFKLVDRLRQRRLKPEFTAISTDELGAADDSAPSDYFDQFARPAEQETLADFSRLDQALFPGAKKFLVEPGNAELRVTLSMVEQGLAWKEIAQALGFSRETLRARRTDWGLGAGITPNSTLGRWMSRYFPLDADHAAHAAYALGVLRVLASSEEQP